MGEMSGSLACRRPPRSYGRGGGVAALLLAAWAVCAPLRAGAAEPGVDALFQAIAANDLAAVKQIVTNGTDPLAKNADGQSAPEAAVRRGHHVIAQFLLSYRRPRPERRAEETEVPLLPPADETAALEPEDQPKTAETPAGPTDEPKETAAPAPSPAAPDTGKRLAGKDADVMDRYLKGEESSVSLKLGPGGLTVEPRAADEAPKAAQDTRETQRLGDETPSPTPLLTPPARPTDSPTADEKDDGEVADLSRPPELAGPEGEDEATGKPAETADTPPSADTPPTTTASEGETAEKTAKKGVFARAKDWIAGLFGFGGEESAKPAPPAPVAADQPSEPEAKTATAQAPEETQPKAAEAEATPAEAKPAPTAQAGLDDLEGLLDTPGDKAAGETGPTATADATPGQPGDDAALTGLDAELAEPPGKSSPAGKDTEAPVDLAAMSVEERIAWLDARLASPVVRDPNVTLEQSREEALAHLRRTEDRGAKIPAAKDGGALTGDLKPDESLVEGPKGPTQHLKIPLPEPEKAKSAGGSRDPWFRDVSPDEPDVRAAHRERRLAAAKAPPPERGRPAPSIPKVPQLENLPAKKPAADNGTAVVPEPPSLAETLPATPTPATPSATPAPPAAPGGLDDLEKEFGAPPADASLDNLDQALTGALDQPAPKDKAAAAPGSLDAEFGGAAEPATAPKGDDLALVLKDAAGPAQETPKPPPTAQEIIAELPKGARMKLKTDGRPVLPEIWTLPVVLPGQKPPLPDLAAAFETPAPVKPSIDKKDADKLLGETPKGVPPETSWPVTRVEMAEGGQLKIPLRGQAAAEAGVPKGWPGGPLEGVTLSLGTDTSLENTFVPKEDKAAGKPQDCIVKAGGRTLFCLTELKWPASLHARFLVSTILYTGTGAIVRFDDGVPVRMHAVFATDGFDEISDWLTRRFGPPTETVNRSIAPFNETRRDNPSYIWKSVDRVTRKVVSLEIRRYDDTRDGFPDMRNGILMLYRDGAPPIFPQVSVHELMRLKRTG